MQIAPTWITSATFAPFGRLIAHPGGPGRYYIDSALDDIAPHARPRLCINQLDRVPRQIAMTQIERHPHTVQSFVPLSPTTLLAALCPSTPDGSPDTAALALFVIPPGTGILYHRGVWHHGLLSMTGPCDIAVLMCQRADGHDTDLHALGPPLTLDRDTLL